MAEIRIAAALAVCLIILAIELPALRRSRRYREMTVYTIILAAALAIYIARLLHVQLPNPLDGIAALYGWLGMTKSK